MVRFIVQYIRIYFINIVRGFHSCFSFQIIEHHWSEHVLQFLVTATLHRFDHEISSCSFDICIYIFLVLKNIYAYMQIRSSYEILNLSIKNTSSCYVNVNYLTMVFCVHEKTLQSFLVKWDEFVWIANELLFVNEPAF